MLVMALGFPNRSRSFDATRHGIRFWGHDRALEISFFLEESALHRLGRRTGPDEAAYLQLFDINRDRILKVAADAYARSRKDFYILAASDF